MSHAKCIATGKLRKYTSVKCVMNVDLLVYRHAEDMQNLLLKRSTTAVQCQHQMLLRLPEHVEHGREGCASGRGLGVLANLLLPHC